jgi:hypothetical protein
LAFRDDILRGVRLFLIAFSVVLVGVWVYRMTHPPSDVQGAENPPPLTEIAAPDQQHGSEADPVASTSSEAHGLVVPPPPPVANARPTKMPPRKQIDEVPPPPPLPVARAIQPPKPVGREFEASEVSTMPAAPREESAQNAPAPEKKAVGYKSLLEVNANRMPADPAGQYRSPDEGADQPKKSNGFLRALGKFFHPSPKETMPLTLQPKPQ